MIRKILDRKEINLLLSIVETYSDSIEDLSQSKKRLQSELDELENNRDIYVKIKDDLPVAMIQIIYNNADNDPDLANGKEVAHIHDLEVHSNLQGKGIGKEMMTFIEGEVSQKKIRRLTLGVDSPNKRAVNLYKKLGYTVFKEKEGRLPEEKLLLMRKDL